MAAFLSFPFEFTVIYLSLFGGIGGKTHTDVAAVLSQDVYVYSLVTGGGTQSIISFVFPFAKSLVTCTALLCSLEHRHLSA